MPRLLSGHVVVDNETIVEAVAPDFNASNALPKHDIAVTTPGRDFDFVSRWFGLRVGVDEDPIAGSAHTWLAPHRVERLGKTVLTARQGSERKGTLVCEVVGEQVSSWPQTRSKPAAQDQPAAGQTCVAGNTRRGAHFSRSRTES